MAEDLREDAGEFYPGGTVVPVVPGGGGSSVTVDDTLTKDGENPVKSKGIWSAIWGAIAAPAASVYEWVTTELKKKQNALSQEQLAAANSGITAEKVEKLDGIEVGAQKNPDLSEYAKKSDIPAAPDLSGYAKTAEVPAAIAGKEIKPSSVVMEMPDAEGGVYQRLTLDGWAVTYEDFELGDGEPKGIGWGDLVIAAKKYDFFECEAMDWDGFAFVDVFPFKINHTSTKSFSGADKSIILYLLKDEGNVSNDLILVFDCYVEGYRIEWTEDGKDYTFHPRGGDAANLEVVAGKRNVFFITEVQPNQFMVARDELELPDAGGGE